jgi:hypothetical protein
MQYNDVDILLKAGFENAKEAAPATVWPNIAEALHKKRRRKFFILFFLLSFVFLASLLSYFYFNNNIKNTETESIVEKINTNVSVYKEVNIDDTKNKDTSSVVIKDKTAKPITALENNIKNNAASTTDNINTINKDDYAERQLNKFHKKGKFAMQITSGTVEENITTDEEPNTKNETALKIEDNVSTFLKPIEKNDSATEIKKTEIIKDANPKKIVIEATTTTTNTKKEKTKKKWDKYFSLAYNALLIGENNIFEKSSTKSNTTSPLSTTGTGGGISFGTVPAISPTYKNGREITLAFLLKENNSTKKNRAQIGFQLNYSSYKNKVYNAIPAAVSADNINFNSPNNSFYSSRKTLNDNSINIANNYFNVGLLLGLETNLLKLNKSQHIVFQFQAVPSLNLSKSINWYKQSNERYFKDKALNRQFNITQSSAVLWKIHNKKYNLLVGPNFNYHLLKLNKNKNNVGNVYTSSFGLTTQINF